MIKVRKWHYSLHREESRLIWIVLSVITGTSQHLCWGRLDIRRDRSYQNRDKAAIVARVNPGPHPREDPCATLQLLHRNAPTCCRITSMHDDTGKVIFLQAPMFTCECGCNLGLCGLVWQRSEVLQSQGHRHTNRKATKDAHFQLMWRTREPCKENICLFVRVESRLCPSHLFLSKGFF